MQMVIMCGGLATRLGNLAKNIPKSMMDINGKPFLEYQIENLRNQGIDDILLCAGHLSEKIEKYFKEGLKFGIDIKYSYDGEKPLGPIGALKNAENLLDDDFFTMYGDSFLSVDYKKVYNFFEKHEKPACMIVYKNYDKYDKSNIIVKENMVIGYGAKNKSKDMIYIDYGASLLNKKTLKIVPKNNFFTTGEFYTNLIKNKKLLAFEVKERFYHIGNPEALEEFKNFIKQR